MSADLALQKAIRARLVATQAVTDLVPSTSIIDTNGTPAPRPSIVLGEAQSLDPGERIDRKTTQVFHTLHVWKTELSREGAKDILSAVEFALMSARLDLSPDYHCADHHVSNVRVMSDPDGESSHGVMVVQAMVEVA